MTWITCPRNREDHNCPNEELGSFMSAELIDSIAVRNDPTVIGHSRREVCSGACDGEIDIDEYEDDPSPPGVGLSPGSYHVVEIRKQTCKCELTDAEFEICVERAHDAYENQAEDYYEAQARMYLDGFDY